MRISLRILALTALVMTAPAMAAEAPLDVAEAASGTFVRGCAAHVGALDKLHERLQPGRDLYLPRLPDPAAKPFLQGRQGEAYLREDAGITLVLLTADDQCAVFVRKVPSGRMYTQLEKDLRVAVGQYFTIRAAGQENKGPMLSRFIDLLPAGEYRAELIKTFGAEPNGLRVILTTSETANPNLQAIITIGTRQP
ncbi:MAG: hypothetical protein HY055_08160 [Magnetospirillum sp.]|nr:hypothetical protein [Magnetospirillum sp.]